MSIERLQLLNFGKDDAEADNSPGGLLATSFLETMAYEAALHGRHQLFIGRKGSGKSATALRLFEALGQEGRACLVTPDEISADEIRRFDLPGIPSMQAKCLLWRYIFAVQVARHMLALHRVQEPREPMAEDLKRVRQFLVDNSEVEDLTFAEKFWRTIERIKGSLKLEAFGVKAEADIEGLSAGIRAETQVDVFVRAVSASSRTFFSRARPFMVVVDQVERIWGNDRSSDLMVIGLLLARDLKMDYVRPVFFLRTDIYELLQFDDRDKLRSEEFLISWNADRLVRLLERRCAASLGTEGALWALFPKKILGVPTQQFLVSLTLMRPRDIIQLCNACRQSALTNEHDRITEKDVTQAVDIYSAWKVSDLINEWRVNYPYLNDVLLMFANSGFLMTRAHIEQRLELVRPSLAQRYPGLEAHFALGAIVAMLHAICFLGVTRQGKTVYQYEGGPPIGPQDNEFCIHPCFRSGIRSTSAVNVAPFEPRAIMAEIAGEARVATRGQPIQRRHRDHRLLEFGVMQMVNLRDALARLTVASELRTDLLNNIDRMESDLKARHRLDDLVGGRESLRRIEGYFRDLRRRLEDSGWSSTAISTALQNFEQELHGALHENGPDLL
jgi:hypothetical protein